MKLVEILARELKEWPKGASHAVQDDGDHLKRVWVCSGSSLKTTISGSEWDLGEGVFPCYSFISTELASDHATAIVTREMWEQERANYAQWKNGLPPIYTRVSIKHKGIDQGTGKVVFFGHVFCVIVNDKGHEQSGRIEHYTFSPFKTFEQIAAEERIEKVAEMLDIVNNSSGCGMYELYDAGYRKTGDAK